MCSPHLSGVNQDSWTYINSNYSEDFDAVQAQVGLGKAYVPKVLCFQIPSRILFEV
jgi:hypothetical protein